MESPRLPKPHSRSALREGSERGTRLLTRRLGGLGEDRPEILPSQVGIAFHDLLFGPAGGEECVQKLHRKPRPLNYRFARQDLRVRV